MRLLESKIIRLVEERGYMGTKYIPVIKQIVKYVENYIYENPKNIENGWEFFIPFNITEKIESVNNLMININVIDRNDANRLSGAGSNTVFYNNKIIDNKLDVGKINIAGYSIGTYLYSRSIFNSLSHELNHLLEIYERLLKNQNYQTIFQKAVTQNDISRKIFSQNEEINNYIRNVFYRLLFKSELNALINGVYGDLDGINSKRNNFNKDIKYTQAYTVYCNIFENIDILDYLSDEEWNNVISCFNINSSFGTKPSVNIKSFKIKFKRLIEEKLRTLLKGIGKIASYYYDSQDDMKPKNNIELIDKDTILKKY